jgi:hypothetical protein
MAVENVKKAAYTAAGVNLVVADAVVRTTKDGTASVTRAVDEVLERIRTGADEARERVARLGDEADKARTMGNDFLTDVRGRTEPTAAKLQARLPEPVAARYGEGRSRAWELIGVDAPGKAAKTKKGDKAKKDKAKKAAKAVESAADEAVAS